MTLSLIDDLIGDAAAQRRVHRRATGDYGVKGRFIPDSAPVIALVRLRVQSRDIVLDRGEDGDTSQGAVDVWAPLTDLAAAEDELDLGVPLGWTELLIVGPKPREGDPDGPPGDKVEWKGRLYEITTEEPHDGDGPLIGGFRRYVGTDRGAA